MAERSKVKEKLVCGKPKIWVSLNKKYGRLHYDFYGYDIRLTVEGYRALERLLHSYMDKQMMAIGDGGLRIFGRMSGEFTKIPIEGFSAFVDKALEILANKENWASINTREQ